MNNLMESDIAPKEGRAQLCFAEKARKMSICWYFCSKSFVLPRISLAEGSQQRIYDGLSSCPLHWKMHIEFGNAGFFEKLRRLR